MEQDRPALRVGMVGHAFMGQVHSHAWRSAARFFDLPLQPRMTALCGRDETRVSEAAHRLGWDSTETDWRRLVERDDIDLVDICTPGDSHADIAIAALQAGKHVLCEKPLANTVAEAESMVAAAAAARERGVWAMVGFTYRRVPAIGLARQLVAEGRLGQLRHVRAQYLQDWIADPSAPMSWRLVKEQAGSGALGDIGAHIVDLTQFVTGDRIESVTAAMRTFVDRRPVTGSKALLGGSSGQNGEGNHRQDGQRDSQPDSEDWGTVTVDDATSFLARFEGGAMGVFEATRFATGRKNAIRVEINGSEGSLAFDFEDMNVLHFHDATEDDRTAGFRRILVTESSHPYVAGWWPPGHVLGYEHGFTHQVVDLVRAVAAAEQPTPSFADGLAVQAVLGAVERSAETGSWQETKVPVGAV